MPRRELSRAQLLSQFFTNEDLAAHVVNTTKHLLEQQGLRWNTLHFVEPAAGDGVFMRMLPRAKSVGVEVDPGLLKDHPEYVGASLARGGFLSLGARDLRIQGVPASHIVFIGNPPYSIPKFDGRSNNVALDFVNHSASMGDTVAMICSLVCWLASVS